VYCVLALICAMPTLKKFALTAMLSLLITACGQTGPLYLPEQTPQSPPAEPPALPIIDDQAI
jgi:predicted small lipoprotein YifL